MDYEGIGSFLNIAPKEKETDEPVPKNKLKELGELCVWLYGSKRAAITTDIIVGFPGETEEDFAATMNLVAEVGFDQSFSFIYSRRPGTPAAALPDSVPHSVKQRRLELLQQRLNAQARAISGDGRHRQRVLVERPAKRNKQQLAGRTDNNRWVNFEGPARTRWDSSTSFVDVQITMPARIRCAAVSWKKLRVSSVPMTRD